MTLLPPDKYILFRNKYLEYGIVPFKLTANNLLKFNISKKIIEKSNMYI